jgi:SAM-dependent methyltransferase
LYDRIGDGYARTRVPDERIGRLISDALGTAVTIVDVGAGTGNYEPLDRVVTAVEPSASMIVQRADGSAPVVRAYAEALPFPGGSFDAAMAIWTVHHWTDWQAGVREMKRVSRDRVIIATWDSAYRDEFWFTREYLPEAAAVDAANFPALGDLVGLLASAEVRPIPIPRDCTDGFMAAFWARPSAFLDPAVIRSSSTFAYIDPEVLDRSLAALRRDLESGEWERRHQALLDQGALDLGYRLVVGQSRRPPDH